jgi:hypothetical protein
MQATLQVAHSAIVSTWSGKCQQIVEHARQGFSASGRSSRELHRSRQRNDKPVTTREVATAIIEADRSQADRLLSVILGAVDLLHRDGI